MQNWREILRSDTFSVQRRVALILYYHVAYFLPDTPLIGSSLSMKFRRFLCRIIFSSMGENTKVHSRVHFGKGLDIHLGEESSLNRGMWIGNDTVIGDNVMFGPEVIILSGSHNFDDVSIPMTGQGASERRAVVIGNDVWIGTRTIILPGVVVGNHAVVGAGSIVTKNVPDWSICAGNPARVIRYRK